MVSALGHADLNTTLGIYGRRDQTDLETAMDAYASWLEQQRTKSFPPKLTAESARLSQKVEAAGIEPAQGFSRLGAGRLMLRRALS
jgi:hypothetical protein